jgi:molybdopterin biosynthesis enzyme
MTEAFWTPEKKADYKKLLEKREKRRKYHREYMNHNRRNGRYIVKYIKGEGKKYFKTTADYKKYLKVKGEATNVG